MAEDQTLPSVLARRHAARRTPVMAIFATALATVAIMFMIPDLTAAGAAASLIFLLAFALTHVIALALGVFLNLVDDLAEPRCESDTDGDGNACRRLAIDACVAKWLGQRHDRTHLESDGLAARVCLILVDAV